MKYIVKVTEPEEFLNWKANENENWKPTYDKLQNPEKEGVFKSLLEEQGHICCYCERKLVNDDYHIEHFRPQDESMFPELQLEYNNILCSCQRNIDKGDPLHCGNSKGNSFEEDLISPLDENCEGNFKYTFDGYIEPSRDSNLSAIKTIDLLKLDIDRLNDMRKNAIEPFLDPELTPQELDDFVAAYLVEKEHNDGRYNEFYTTIRYLFA